MMETHGTISELRLYYLTAMAHCFTISLATKLSFKNVNGTIIGGDGNKKNEKIFMAVKSRAYTFS